MLLSSFGATSVFAQSSLLATLSHEGNITTYYGAVALKDAYEAASNGDVITLSSGTFSAVNIEKAITIRGAGMSSNPNMGAMPTILTGDFQVTDPEERGDNKLTIEGIYHNSKIYLAGEGLTNGTFLKCRLYHISYTNNAVWKDLSVINCKVAYTIDCRQGSTVHFVNSILNLQSNNSSSTLDFINCAMRLNTYLSNTTITITNCAIYYTNGGNTTGGGCTSYNNVAFSAMNGTPFYGVTNQTNTLLRSQDGHTVGELFKTFEGSYLDDETFELSEDAKTTYKGNDGTEIGIYGGSLPFDPTPSNPQITKCNVAAKSTADGKLSVDIEVNGAQ